MITIKEIIQKYSKFLKKVTNIPQKEIEIIILSIVQKDIIWLHLNYNSKFEYENQLKEMVFKRATNYPLEYITKNVSFYSEIFNIIEGVLIPRPETEILIEKTISIISNIKNPKVLEIGCGSGVISIILAKEIKDINIKAVDINQIAINLSKKNSKKFSVNDKIEFIKSDMFQNLENLDFDLIISNPPYIEDNYNLPENVKYEPYNALFGGVIGDEFLKKIIDKYIESNIKYLCCEIGYNQKNSLNNYFKKIDKTIIVNFYKDLEGFDRGFLAKK